MPALPRFLGHGLRGLRPPPWLLPLLPGESTRYGPPRRRATLTEYFARHPGELREVEPAAPAPDLPGAEDAPGLLAGMKRRARIPPAYVFTLPRARLLGPDGWIVGEGDSFLPEASFWRERDHPHPFSTHFILLRKRARPLRRLPGRTLSLASDFAAGGFGHFLHDSLPRLHLVEKAGHDLRDFDWVYLPRIDTPATRQLVARLDLPPERVLAQDPRHDLFADELVATSYPGTPGYIPSYAPALLRERFLPTDAPASAASAGRRIFLSREGFRRDLAARAQVEQLLRARGFEIVRPQVDDAIAACAEAACVVAQEGSNFMNALFCPSGARLLLLCPPTVDLPYALSLAAAGGHHLRVVETPSPSGDPEGKVGLDLARFERTLDALLA